MEINIDKFTDVMLSDKSDEEKKEFKEFVEPLLEEAKNVEMTDFLIDSLLAMGNNTD